MHKSTLLILGDVLLVGTKVENGVNTGNVKVLRGAGAWSLRWWTLGKQGPTRHKKPLPAIRLRRGCVSTRAAWKPTHTARLPARWCIHCSDPHGKGYCSMNIPAQHGEFVPPQI